MTRLVFISMVSVLVLALSLGCAGPAASPQTVPAKEGPRGSIVFATNAMGEQHGDPHRIVVGTERMYTTAVADGLVRRDADGKIVPAIASSWTVSADGLTWDFTIRKGVKFQNGDTVTPEDVAFSIKRALDPKYKNYSGPTIAKVLDTIEVNGDHVILRLKEPFASLLDRLYLFFGIVPKKYVESIGDDEFDKRPVGAGPFKIVENKPGEYLKLEAFEESYRGAPGVKYLTFKLVPEAATRVAMLKSGEADIIQRLSFPMAEDVKRSAGLQVIPMRYGRSYFMKFFDLVHPEPSPVKDVRVRQAFSYAIDRETLVKTVYAGYAEPIPTPLPPHMFGYDQSMKPYPYDPEKAKKLLAEAGYPNGFEIVLHGSIDDREGPQAVAGMLAKVGIKVTLDIDKQFSAYTAQQEEKKQRGLGWQPHSGQALWELSGIAISMAGYERYGYINNPTLDELFKKSDRETDDAKRAAITREAQKILYDNVDMLGMFATHEPFGVGSKIKQWNLGDAGQAGILENIMPK